MICAIESETSPELSHIHLYLVMKLLHLIIVYHYISLLVYMLTIPYHLVLLYFNIIDTILICTYIFNFKVNGSGLAHAEKASYRKELCHLRQTKRMLQFCSILRFEMDICKFIFSAISHNVSPIPVITTNYNARRRDVVRL